MSPGMDKYTGVYHKYTQMVHGVYVLISMPYVNIIRMYSHAYIYL